jgi:hypothetical protein
MRSRSISATLLLTAIVASGVGCDTRINTADIKSAADSVRTASDKINQTGVEIGKAGALIKQAAAEFDPGNFKGAAHEIRMLREELKSREQDIAALTDQLLDKVPMSIVGTYRPRYLSDKLGEESFVEHSDGNTFRFYNRSKFNVKFQ